MTEIEWLVRALVVGLGGWRLAHMLVEEAGPYDVFERIRQRAGVVPGEIEGFWGLLLACIYCTSVWTASGLWLAWEIHPALAAIPAAWAIAVLPSR